jgi:hypothetical protein
MSFSSFGASAFKTDLNLDNFSKYTGSTGLNATKFPAADTKNWASTFDPKGPFSTSFNSAVYNGDLLSAFAQGQNTDAWTFITAPGSVNYTQNSDVQRVELFGTNAPPVTVASVGMRDLSLSDALMEGFTLGKSVQPHIDRLENLMDVTLDQEGFVSVPVYEVFSGPGGSGKSYGLYVIEQVEIDEQMRDTAGMATRAMVSLSLKQVPQYQVGTGVDQAGASTGGGAITPSTTQAAKQASTVAQGNAGKSVASAAAAAGGGAAANSTPASAAAAPGSRLVTRGQ